MAAFTRRDFAPGLNQIAQESGSNFWVFRRYPNGAFEIKLQCC